MGSGSRMDDSIHEEGGDRRGIAVAGAGIQAVPKWPQPFVKKIDKSMVAPLNRLEIHTAPI